MQSVIELLELLRRVGARLGPYVVLELLLPGGTMLALLLFLHRRLKAHSLGFSALPASQPAPISAVYEAPSHPPAPHTRGICVVGEIERLATARGSKWAPQPLF